MNEKGPIERGKDHLIDGLRPSNDSREGYAFRFFGALGLYAVIFLSAMAVEQYSGIIMLQELSKITMICCSVASIPYAIGCALLMRE